jgi:hypothetical protein
MTVSVTLFFGNAIMPSQKGKMAAFSTLNTASGVGIHSRPGGGNA